MNILCLKLFPDPMCLFKRIITAVDYLKPGEAGNSEAKAIDLNIDFTELFPAKHFDCCFSLDVIEHLNSPEEFLKKVFTIMKPHGRLYISTANVAYFPVRFSLLLGQFNYGQRGILDMTHKRLFSVNNFKKMIVQYGYKIEVVRGFAPPVTDMVNNSWLFKMIESIHAFFSRLLPNFFAFNFLVIATRLESVDDILAKTLTPKR